MRKGGHGISRRSRSRGKAPSVPRRRFLQAALAASIGLAAGRARADDDDKPGADERPQPGDHFVHAEGDLEGKAVALADIKRDDAPLQVWPVDPTTKTVRDGSRLNPVLLLRLDPASLDEDTAAHAADGIVAFSAICSHAGCPVTGWITGDSGKQVLKCFCHNSEYDPRQNAAVVFGPAPRKLAALPLKIADGTLTVAGPFIGKVVPSQQG
jgi:Rieske Fe-S protein